MAADGERQKAPVVSEWRHCRFRPEKNRTSEHQASTGTRRALLTVAPVLLQRAGGEADGVPLSSRLRELQVGQIPVGAHPGDLQL